MQICFKCNGAVQEQLDALAKRRGQSRADVCRDAIRQFLETEARCQRVADQLSEAERDALRFGLAEAGFWERFKQEGLG